MHSALMLVLFVFMHCAASAVISPLEEIAWNDTLLLGLPFAGRTLSSVSSLIEPRQRKRCLVPGDVLCPDGNSCCTAGYTCQPAIAWCCPPGGLQCGGLACCNPATAVCCGSGCCSRQPPPTKPSTTSPRTTTTSKTSSSSRPTNPACSVFGRDVYGRQVADCPTPTAKPSTSKSAVKPTETAKPTERPPPPPVETRIPVATATFDYPRLIQGSKKGVSSQKQAERQRAVDQLFESMCKGLKSLGESSSTIFTFTDDQKVKNDNRANAGCTGSPCDTANTGKSCEEFPFASTTDGGLGAVFTCIDVLAQNIQGGVLSGFKRRFNIKDGDHYKFEITGYDCDTNSPTAAVFFAGDEGTPMVIGVPAGNVTAFSKRNLLPGGSENDEMVSFPPFTALDTNNTIIHSVGDIPVGTYTISARVNQGTVSSLRVVDYIGDEHARADVVLNDNGQQTLTFTLESDGVGIGFFMDTQLDAVNISSTMQIGNANVNSAAPRSIGTLITSALAVLLIVILL